MRFVCFCIIALYVNMRRAPSYSPVIGGILVVQKLQNSKRSECDHHRTVFRPWGHYDSIDIEDNFIVKRILVNPRSRLSLQKHQYRAEHWVVVKGYA